MDNVIRVALVGPGGSGKTEIMRRLLGESFRPAYYPSEDQTEHILDFAGYRFIVTEYSGQYYRSAQDFQDVSAYILVSTSSRVDRRYAHSLQKIMPQNIPFCIMVNKSDIDATTQENMCSAKRNENLDYPFHAIANQILSQV